MSGYQNRSCECRSVNTQCNIPLPQCPARNYARTCSPIPECTQTVPTPCPRKLATEGRCLSAPPCKRNEFKDWYSSRSKTRDLLRPDSATSRTPPRKTSSGTAKQKQTKPSPQQNVKKEQVNNNKTQESNKKVQENTKKQPENNRKMQENNKKEPENSKKEQEKNKKEQENDKKDVPAKVQQKPATVKRESDAKSNISKTSDAQEHEYVYFLLKITEDILRNNIYKNEDMDKLFESHIQANLGRLNEGRMHEQIERLKKELDLPLTKRDGQCGCSEDDFSKTEDCTCCPAYHLADGETLMEACSCNNLKCPVNVMRALSSTQNEPYKAESTDVEASMEPKVEESVEEKASVKPEVTCAEVQCCIPPEEENVSPDEEIVQKGEEKTSKVDTPPTEELPEEFKEPETTGSKTKKVCVDSQKPEVTPMCEEIFCCSDTIGDTIGDSQPKESPDKNTRKKKEDCLNFDECTDPASKPCLNNMQSVVKITNKNDPKKTESHIIYYNPRQAEEQCICTMSLQKTALKIQVDDTNNDEYILVDGPVCIPRSWLDSKTIPVLVQNVSSMLLEDMDDKQHSMPSFSKLNLVRSPSQSDNVDNFDSVSGQIKRAEHLSDYDLTPQRDVEVESLKKEEDSKSSREKSVTKTASFADDTKDKTKRTSKDSSRTEESPQSQTKQPSKESSRSEEIPQSDAKRPSKESSRSEEKSANIDGAKKKSCVPSDCAKQRKDLEAETHQKQQACTRANCQGYKKQIEEESPPVKEEYTELVQEEDKLNLVPSEKEEKPKLVPSQEEEKPKLVPSQEKKHVCATGSCEKTICPKLEQRPSTKITPKMKELDTVIQSEEFLPQPTMKNKGSICSMGSCGKDKCPKKIKYKSPAEMQKSMQQRSISSQLSLTKINLSQLSDEKDKGDHTELPITGEVTGDDFANKYHFLLMDAATSTSTFDSSTLPVIRQSSGPPTVKSVEGLHVPYEENVQQEEYMLLMDEEYQATEGKHSITSTTSSVKAPPTPPKKLSATSSESSPPPPKRVSSPPPPATEYTQPDESDHSVRDSTHSSKDTSDKSDKDKKVPPPDLKIFQYSNIPPRIVNSAEPANDLTYTQKEPSESANEHNSIYEAYRRQSEMLQIPPLFPTHPALKQSNLSNVSSAQTTSKPDAPKVRYSLTHDLYTNPHQEDVIAKLDEMPAPDEISTSAKDKEAESIEAITEKMKQFRRISGDENANRRFQISNPDQFEIRKVSTTDSGGINEDDSNIKPKKKTCCGLAAPPKTKRKSQVHQSTDES